MTKFVQVYETCKAGILKWHFENYIDNGALIMNFNKTNSNYFATNLPSKQITHVITSTSV